MHLSVADIDKHIKINISKLTITGWYQIVRGPIFKKS